MGEWKKPARALLRGDVVHISAGVKHWHGAAGDSWFTHLAINVPGENGSNEWLEPVSADDSAFLRKMQAYVSVSVNLGMNQRKSGNELS